MSKSPLPGGRGIESAAEVSAVAEASGEVCHWRTGWLGLLISIAVAAAAKADTSIPPPSNYGVHLSLPMDAAVVDVSAGELELRWTARTDVQSYSIEREDPGGGLQPPIVLGAAADSLLVSGLVPGQSYEWRMKATLVDCRIAYGFLRGGIDVALVENRGRVLILAAPGLPATLAPELDRLQEDLAGDGWRPSLHEISALDGPTDLKAVILAEHAADPLETVFLFGDVPVPYSGVIFPDGHFDHRGAWPADMYYGDTQGQWTDSWQVATGAASSRNHNVIGDGKFDQSVPPGGVDLMVGRVDLSDLPAFAPKTEIDLLRQYLDKDNAFRHAQLAVPATALVDDHLPGFTEALSLTARNGFAATVGRSAVANADWPDTAGAPAYLLGAGIGSGNYTKINGVATITSLATHNPQVVFSAFFGSYSGDWDVSNNFLRAPLACEGTALASAYSGRPQWQLHPLGLGVPLGEVARLSQNAGALAPYYTGYSSQQIHTALHGDPTLRLFPRAAAQNASVIRTPAGAQLTWSTPVPGGELLGYHVYRAAQRGDAFVRLNGQLLAGTSFVDPAPSVSAMIYQVRAIYRETTGSGSFINSAQAASANLPAAPMVQIGPGQLSASEGQPPVQLQFTRSGNLGAPLEVPLDYSGTAAGGGDVTGMLPSVTFAIGEAGATLDLTATDDGQPEGAEELFISVADGGFLFAPDPAAGTTCLTLYDAGYGSFAVGWFGHEAADPAVAGELADPDGDGLCNLIEYAIGSSPLISQPPPLTDHGDHSDGGVDYRRFSHPQLEGVSGVTLTVEISPDLITWTEPGGTVITSDAASPIETIEVLVPKTLCGARCFARLTAVSGAGS